MNGELEIIIPVRDGEDGLSQTIASIVAQTDRNFTVLLSDNHACVGLDALAAAQHQLQAAGIASRRLQPPRGSKHIEHWNWAHAQSRAAWLKPLFPGEELKPAFVSRLRQRIAANPKAQLIRCDTELQLDWGKESLTAPFAEPSIKPAAVLDYFPVKVDWLSRSLPFAYGRTAWLALGGFSPQLPASAILNLNVLLALHFGMENIAETLASVDLTGEHSLNESPGERVNTSLELWFILRQAKNYCLASKLPWPEQCLLWRSFAATMGRR